MATFSRIILPAILILISAIVLRSASIQYNPPLSTIQLNTLNTFQGFAGKFAYINKTSKTCFVTLDLLEVMFADSVLYNNKFSLLTF